MARKKLWLLPLLVWLAVSLACSSSSNTNFNGLKGSAADSGTSCKAGMRQGECSGELNKISGTFYKSFENGTLRPGDNDVTVEAVVSVGSGAVKVYVLDSAGQQHAAEIKAGETATLLGKASSFSESFNVFFEALGGEAGQVKYTVRYAAED